MNKNIYLLTLKDWGYDEYEGWVVIAENEEEVISLCEIYKTEEEARKVGFDNQFIANILQIKLIGTAEQEESEIVLSSFHAG